ncbi:membrane protein [Paenarthrobacter nicotinovorans]|uniref:membrane protein n=1 Tax=Paenarthrobacter nicotinovorans TaxID=29320 RepID=UPI00047B2E85|nr:membrane protein [Paenarthrobacter nicotinovorans]
MGPAFLSELRRPWLWKGSAVGAALVLGFMALMVLAAALEAGPTLASLGGPLMEAGLTLTLTGSAVVGSFAFTADFRTGSFSRRVLMFQRVPAFLGRAAATALAALISGALIGLIFVLAGELLGEAWQLGLPACPAFAGVAGMGSIWGFAAGSLIRNHLVSLFAVPLTLLLPEMLPGSGLPFFPVLAADWATQATVNIPAWGSFAGAAAWLLVVLAVAFVIFLKRDLA